MESNPEPQQQQPQQQPATGQITSSHPQWSENKKYVGAAVLVVLSAWFFPAMSRQWGDRRTGAEARIHTTTDTERWILSTLTTDWETFDPRERTDPQRITTVFGHALVNGAVVLPEVRSFYGAHSIAHNRFRTVLRALDDYTAIACACAGPRRATSADLQSVLGPNANPLKSAFTLVADEKNCATATRKCRVDYQNIGLALDTTSGRVLGKQLLGAKLHGFSVSPSDLWHQLTFGHF